MKIAILGTRGIPNEYGGFEQFAEYIGRGLVGKGHEVTIYNSSEHSLKENTFKGVHIVHKYCPEKKIGALAHFLFDWQCSKHASSKNYDIIYHAGYGSAAPAIFMFSRQSKSIWVTNMDGLEWKRDKWSKPVKWITKQMERIAVKYSDHLISDNVGIQEYYKKTYNAISTFLPYGAEIPKNVSEQPLKEFNVKPNQFYILVARLEPENSIETILDGFCESNSKTPFIVVGGDNTNYGRFLKKKFRINKKIVFVGGVYNVNKLNSLRRYAKLYFHGHTVGGTNPSLLEAMALGASIVAHNNPFNFSVLESFGDYFSYKEDVCRVIEKKEKHKNNNWNKEQCVKKIKENYNWKKIINDHESFFKEITTCRSK